MDKIRIYIALLFCQAISLILPVQAQNNTGSDSNRYNTLYSYDCMGNITSLSRNGLLDDGSYDYYPYGGLMSNSTGWNTQRYKYNGKEFDRMHGLDWYDYGARWMDAAIGRWHVMDPLCEKYYDVSPYNYCRNNPILYFDKNGCEGEGFLTKFGDSFQNVGLAAAAFGTATIIISAEAEIATLGVSSIPSVVGVSSGAAAIIAGSVTYTIGSAMKITERIMQNASSQGKKSVDSGKNERHGDGGRAMNRPSTAKQIKDLDAQIKNAKNKKERQRLEKKQDNIKREAQRKKHGEEHSRGSKR